MLTEILKLLKERDGSRHWFTASDVQEQLREIYKQPSYSIENPEDSSSWHVLIWLQLKLICTTPLAEDPKNSFSDLTTHTYTNLEGVSNFLKVQKNLTYTPELLQAFIDARYEILLTEYIAYELSRFHFEENGFSAEGLLSRALVAFKKRLLKESLLHFENIYAKEHNTTIRSRFNTNNPIPNDEFAIEQVGLLYTHLVNEDQKIPLESRLNSFLAELSDSDTEAAVVFNTLGMGRFLSINTHLNNFSELFTQLEQKVYGIFNSLPSPLELEEEKPGQNLPKPSIQKQPSPLKTNIKKMFELMLEYPFMSAAAVGIIIAGAIAGIMYASNLPLDLSLKAGGFVGAALVPPLFTFFVASRELLEEPQNPLVLN